jgi:hypothetical protein
MALGAVVVIALARVDLDNVSQLDDAEGHGCGEPALALRSARGGDRR